MLLCHCVHTFLETGRTKGSKSGVRLMKRKAKCFSRIAPGQTVSGRCNRPELLFFPVFLWERIWLDSGESSVMKGVNMR